jgi:hypothetical protein
MQISDRITNLQANIHTWDLPNTKKEHSNTHYLTMIFYLFMKNIVHKEMHITSWSEKGSEKLENLGIDGR